MERVTLPTRLSAEVIHFIGVPPQERLEVHVLGGSRGESIIIRLPSGADQGERWGVVDCYARSLQDPQSNETLRFLHERGVHRLEFLCLTHPHADHYRGISQLLTALDVRAFWQFNSPYSLLWKLVAVLKRGARSAEEAENATDLDTTLQLVKAHRITRRFLAAHVHLYPLPEPPRGTVSFPDLRIEALAPADDQIARYHGVLEDWFATEGWRSSVRPAGLNHNDISGALLITYGRTRVILGGDTGRASWEYALRAFDPSHLSARVVKVSHHGSCTGYCAGLWEAFCANGPTYAIITPNRRFDLPRPEAVAHIKSHASHVMTTCLPAVRLGPRPQPEFLEAEFHGILTTGFSLAPQQEATGRCSLVLDADGQCEVQYDGAAGLL
jgi:beta-lactamase superfamily II metal-dependent hydrolase